MHIAVIGVGGGGGYFGARLAQAGEDVTFITRGEPLRAMRTSGLRVERVDGDLLIEPILVTDDPVTVDPVDIVLLAVKSWQASEAIACMRLLMGAETLAIPLLNGVEAPNQIAVVYRHEHVAGGLCSLFGAIVAPGHIRNTMPQPFVTFARLDRTATGRLEPLQAAYERVGVRATITSDIRAALWEKLLLAGPCGGVAAVTRARVGAFRSLPKTRALLEGALTEVIAVARALGTPIAEGAMDRTLATIARQKRQPLQCSVTSSRVVLRSWSRRSVWSSAGRGRLMFRFRFMRCSTPASCLRNSERVAIVPLTCGRSASINVAMALRRL
jgi:2-dehydropantoate 2-reductase